MALSTAELTRLRLMVDEPDDTNGYTDAVINTIADGTSRIPDTASLGPSETGYVNTYDLYMLAAEIYRLKAGAVSKEFDFEAEGAVFNRSQQYQMLIAQSVRYASMSAYRSTTTLPSGVDV